MGELWCLCLCSGAAGLGESKKGCSKSPRQRQLPNKGESNKFLGSLVTIKKFLWPRHYSSILNYLKTWPHWAVVVEQWKLERKAEKNLLALDQCLWHYQQNQQPSSNLIKLRCSKQQHYKVTTSQMPIPLLKKRHQKHQNNHVTCTLRQ